MAEKYSGIDHLGLAVNDLGAARHTYGELLGFQVSEPHALESRGLEVCFVDTGNARIELLGATRADSEISKFLAKRGEGIHHVCIAVPDIEVALQGLRTRGAQVIGDGVQEGAHNTRVVFVHPKSTHGVLLELVERRP